MNWPGLGRLYKPDPRDANYRIRAIAPRLESDRVWRFWNDFGWWGDQGNSPQCVAFSSMHYMADGPVTHAVKPLFDPATFFADIGGTDQGAYIRDAMKLLRDRGFITEFRWAMSIDEVRYAILERGPVLIGIPWFESMFEPDAGGVIRPSGAIVGGHAIVVNGYNGHNGLYRLKNSWGRGWAHGGHCLLTEADLEYLVFGADGEACIATEISNPSPLATDLASVTTSASGSAATVNTGSAPNPIRAGDYPRRRVPTKVG